MEYESKILVTGGHGMVGSALCRSLGQKSFSRVLCPRRDELELLNRESVRSYFDRERPEYVFMVAAKVGGIQANRTFPVDFLKDNLEMQLNLFEACHTFKTRKNLFFGSSCIYPREAPQPLREEYLLTGPLEPTNEGYAIAKIAGIKLAQFYYEQYGELTVCPMPCNIYGSNDYFDERSHVIAALVRRFVEAAENNSPSVTVWGTGTARREFIHTDDVGEATLFVMDHVDSPGIINVGTGVDNSIAELAQLIAEFCDYKGEILWDSSKPDGMPRKCLDVSRLTQLGFQPKIDLKAGLAKTIDEFKRLRLNN